MAQWLDFLFLNIKLYVIKHYGITALNFEGSTEQLTFPWCVVSVLYFASKIH